MIYCTVIETHADVKIKLLCPCETPFTAPVDKLQGALVAIVTNVFNEHVDGRAKFFFKRESRFKGRISKRLTRVPSHGDHTIHSPPILDTVRPGELHIRLIARAQDLIGARREA